MTCIFNRLSGLAADPAQAASGGSDGPGGEGREAATLTALQFVDELYAQIDQAEFAPQTHDPGALPELEQTRPYTLLNMIASLDGRATAEGRSGPLGARPDRELFHALRTLPDAVLIGSRTLRIERYNRIVDDEQLRARRLERGLAAEPLACILSSTGELDPSIPLLSDAGARILLIGGEHAELDGCGAQVQYLRSEGSEHAAIGNALTALRRDFGVSKLLCEGGPHTAMELIAAGLLDELMITIAPVLIGGDIASAPVGTRGTSGEERRSGMAAMALLSGPLLEPPVRLRLISALSSNSFLFLRYRVAN